MFHKIIIRPIEKIIKDFKELSFSDILGSLESGDFEEKDIPQCEYDLKRLAEFAESKLTTEPKSNDVAELVENIASESANYGIYLLLTQNPSKDIERETLINQIIDLRKIMHNFFNLLMDCKEALTSQPDKDYKKLYEDLCGAFDTLQAENQLYREALNTIVEMRCLAIEDWKSLKRVAKTALKPIANIKGGE